MMKPVAMTPYLEDSDFKDIFAARQIGVNVSWETVIAA